MIKKAFIKLTDLDGSEIWLEIGAIDYMRPMPKENTTTLGLRSGNFLCVSESFDTIREKIQNSGY